MVCKLQKSLNFKKGDKDHASITQVKELEKYMNELTRTKNKRRSC